MDREFAYASFLLSKRKGLNAFLKAEGNKLKGMMDTAG